MSESTGGVESYDTIDASLQTEMALNEDGSGYLECEFDDQWDNIDDSAGFYVTLRSEFVLPGYLAIHDGNKYVFVTHERKWCLITSNTGVKHICLVLGIRNATTNFVAAASPFIPWLSKHAFSTAARMPPLSVCVGTRRREIYLTGDTMSFIDSRPLLDLPRTSDPRAAFCSVNPVSFTQLPLSWKYPGAMSVESYLYPLFRRDSDMDTVKWVIGNCLLEPTSTPRAMIVFGPGGTGKSTLLNVITEMLEGACGTVPDGTYTNSSKSLSDKVVAQLIGNRMVVCGDADGMESLNTHALKTSVGHDFIDYAGYKTKVICSLTIATNGLPDPIKDREYTSDPVMRRTLCVFMNTAASLLPQLRRHQDQKVLVDFMCSCLYVRMQHEHVPISSSNVLLTLCGARWVALSREVEECDDPSLDDMIEVLCLIHAYTLIPLDNIAHKASLISRNSVVRVCGRLFLRGLKPRD